MRSWRGFEGEGATWSSRGEWRQAKGKEASKQGQWGDRTRCAWGVLKTGWIRGRAKGLSSIRSRILGSSSTKGWARKTGGGSREQLLKTEITEGSQVLAERVLFVCFNLCQLLAVACRIFSCDTWTLSCGMWDLVPWPEIEPMPPALGAQSLNHWTTRAVPAWSTLKRFCRGVDRIGFQATGISPYDVWLLLWIPSFNG